MEDAIKLQLDLNKHINLNSNGEIEDIKLVAGIDLVYWEDLGKEHAVCSIIVVDYNTHEVIEKVHSVGEIGFPYMPGCLAFRELPLVMEATSKLNSMPDVFIFDGNGYLHPRHMGIATHAGIYLKKPTIGVAKSYYKVDHVDFVMPDNMEGAYTDIVIHDEVYGRALRTHKNVKPVFVSVGNNIDLDIATEIVSNLVTSTSHYPIPTRLADIETRKLRKVYKDQVQA